MTDQAINSKAQLQEMLDSGKISEDEFDELLEALEDSESPVQAKLTTEAAPPPVPEKAKHKNSLWLEICGVMSLLICFFVLGVWIPTFEDIFRDIGGRMPLVTRVAVFLSSFLRWYGFFVFPVCLGLIITPAIVRRHTAESSLRHALVLISLFEILIILSTTVFCIAGVYYHVLMNA